MFLKPLIHYTDSSESSKILTLRKTCEIKNLLCACQMLRQGQWNSAGANFVKDKLISLSRSDKYKKAHRNRGLFSASGKKQLLPTVALSVFVEASLSRRQYKVI